MKYSCVRSPSVNYAKTLAWLQESLRTGRFAGYSQQKKQEIWNLLCSYARQLGIKIKAPIVAACVAAGLCLATPAEAQVSFAAQTGAANPFNGVSVGTYAKPAFVDIDGDGDLDAFVGTSSGGGAILYYKNTGTATSPVFTLQSGAANPFDGISISYASPTFVDIDGDGDQDAFIGTADGSVLYYKNTGTKTAPVFTLQSGAANPLNGISVDSYSSPVAVDIDGDGDFDIFIGARDGSITYCKNTGTKTAPVFVVQSGAANPLNGVNTGGGYATPAFLDADGDGDFDVLIGSDIGPISYYKNTGTVTAPVFTAQTGAANPFNGVNPGTFSSPAAVDINGDSKTDIFIGVQPGTISYYKNTSIPLPLLLLGFSGIHQPGYNQLQWQTASEVDTRLFELESSGNGADFTTVATINAAGSGNHDYSYRDETVYIGKVFYRLKMIDIDDQFTYSQIIWIDNQQEDGITLYPNPARGQININVVGSAMLHTKAALYSADGRLLQYILITAPQQPINVQSLANGPYFLSFANGTVSRFIKE